MNRTEIISKIKRNKKEKVEWSYSAKNIKNENFTKLSFLGKGLFWDRIRFPKKLTEGYN